MSKYYSIFFFILFITISLYAINSDYSRDLLDMTLYELMDIEIDSGTITGISRSENPAAVTIISRDDIQSTPARNIYDLIEIYVPGATYVSHFQGFRLGIRGQLSDQNYSYQLLVNGKNMNFNAYYGMMLEMQNKDLNDIERIEIIRGPGSVTYGPGATAGTINIVTKSAETNHVNIGYEENIQYRYTRKSIELSAIHRDLDFYLYGSISESEGLGDTGFWYIDRAHGYGWGYMGPDWGNYGLGSDVPSFLEDYRDMPEIKLYTSIKYKDRINLSMRYNTYNHSFMNQKSQSEEGTASAGHLVKTLSAELSCNNSLDILFWNNSIGFKSISFRQINLWARDLLPFNHIAQVGNSFSENEILLKSWLKYDNKRNFKIAFALEGGYEYYAPEWGKDDNTFIFSLQAPIRFAVLDSTSGFYQYYGDGIATIIDEDINAWKYAISGEINWKLVPKFRMLVSTRLDKHKISNAAVSPRVTLIGDIDEHNLIKLTAQRAVRFPIFSDLFSSDYLHNEKSDPEILKGLELTYQRFQNENLEFRLTGYYNNIEQLSWIGDDELTDVIGEFDLMGLEFEGLYQYRDWKLGGSYSWINQLNWDGKINQTAWITGLDDEQIFIEDNGENRINNLPAHSLKLFGRGRITDDIILHLDGRFQWDYQQKEMLDVFERAHQEYGNQETLQEYYRIRDELEDHGYGELSFTSNIAINWALPIESNDLSVKLYAMNLISFNHIRYVIQYWEHGNLRQYPRQCGFIDEPLTVGIDFCLTLR